MGKRQVERRAVGGLACFELIDAAVGVKLDLQDEACGDQFAACRYVFHTVYAFVDE